MQGGGIRTGFERREVGISILVDLRDGRFGREGLDLLGTVMSTQLKRLPILYADRRFDDDLVWDFVQDFVDERWERTVAALLAEATGDDSMTRLLHRIVRYWLIDQVRKTDRGSVLRRLKEHLADDAMFDMVPDGEPGAGRWRLVGAQGPPWGGRIDDLVAAAYKVPAAAVRWRDPTRRPPIARAADLTAILKEVMAAAGHQSIELHQLVVVIMLRFPATLDPESRTIDTDSAVMLASEPIPELELEEQREASELATAAAQVFAQLTTEEKQLLPLILDPAAVQAHLSCGRSTAYSRINKLKTLVREISGTYDDPQQVVLEVLALCSP